jgi:hypothetical protein
MIVGTYVRNVCMYLSTYKPNQIGTFVRPPDPGVSLCCLRSHFSVSAQRPRSTGCPVSCVRVVAAGALCSVATFALLCLCTGEVPCPVSCVLCQGCHAGASLCCHGSHFSVPSLYTSVAALCPRSVTEFSPGKVLNQHVSIYLHAGMSEGCKPECCKGESRGGRKCPRVVTRVLERGFGGPPKVRMFVCMFVCLYVRRCRAIVRTRSISPKQLRQPHVGGRT